MGIALALGALQACANGSELEDRAGEAGGSAGSGTGGASGAGTGGSTSTGGSGGGTGGASGGAGGATGGASGASGASGGATGGTAGASTGGVGGATGGAGSTGGAGGASGGAGGASGGAGGATGGAGGSGGATGGTGGAAGAAGSTGGAGGVDPCAGVTCLTPPPAGCNGDARRTYGALGSCNAGQCEYFPFDLPCPDTCQNAVCVDRCAGVTCTTPPSTVCADASTLRTYGATGTCAAGQCSYSSFDAQCPKGCANAACNQCAVDGDCSAGNFCSGGQCSPCTSDAHCGAQCLVCSGTRPRCLTSLGVCAECIVDADCGAGMVCSSNNCIVGACSQPAESCQDGNQGRTTCADAKVIGRIAASTGTGEFLTGNTCSQVSYGSNAASCTDDGPDNSYRIWLRQGDSLQIASAATSTCPGSTWNRTLKVFLGSGCSDKSCNSLLTCVAMSSNYNTLFTASTSGWYVLVIDGETANDLGGYNLTVKLTCSVSGCGC